ncbi:MAG: hypothetical protein U0835_16375 [Isosphaeraceae bacterium]
MTRIHTLKAAVLRPAPCVLMAVLLAASPGWAGDPPKTQAEPSVWMKQKLAASHNVLTALAKEDYNAIEANAKTMLAVGFLESFARADAPGYREMMADFRYANRSLVLASKEKNLDGATVAYVQLTLSCVNCHKIVRGSPR